jgi:hypothetical protein
VRSGTLVTGVDAKASPKHMPALKGISQHKQVRFSIRSRVDGHYTIMPRVPSET